MCYTAIPGQTGICAVRNVELGVRLTPKLASVIFSAFTTPAYAVAPQVESMSHDFIACCGDSRRYNRYDSFRGKRLAKRQHKPDWRNYEKY